MKLFISYDPEMRTLHMKITQYIDLITVYTCLTSGNTCSECSLKSLKLLGETLQVSVLAEILQTVCWNPPSVSACWNPSNCLLKPSKCQCLLSPLNFTIREARASVAPVPGWVHACRMNSCIVHTYTHLKFDWLTDWWLTGNGKQRNCCEYMCNRLKLNSRHWEGIRPTDIIITVGPTNQVCACVWPP